METIDIAGEKIQAGHNGPVRAQFVLVHDIFVVKKASDVVVWRVREKSDRRVRIYYLRENAARN